MHFDQNFLSKAVLKKTEDPVVKQDLVEMDRCVTRTFKSYVDILNSYLYVYTFDNCQER